jgi:AcrR family transcriptional regulator
VDGRRLRSERTRAAVVRALWELIGEGDLRPTAERIAERAGVSERTVFQHFKAREAMFMAMTELQTEAIQEIWKRLPREGSYEDRFEAFLDQRVRLHEFITPTRRSALLWAPDSKAIADGVTLVRRLMRIEVERVFAEEIAGSDQRRAAVQAAAGWSFWNNLREHQGLEESEAREVLRLTLTVLLRR